MDISDNVFTLEMNPSSKYAWFVCENCGSEMFVPSERIKGDEITGSDIHCYVCDGSAFERVFGSLRKVLKPAQKYKSGMTLLADAFHSINEEGQENRMAVIKVSEFFWLTEVVGFPEKDISFDSGSALEKLGGEAPSSQELTRLVHFYPSYEKLHRTKLLHDLVSGKGHVQMLNNQLALKGLNPKSKQSKGNAAKQIPAKLRRTVIRLLYLRLRIDAKSPLTKKQANEVLLQEFSDDLGPDAISACTKSKIVDDELGN